jgi:tRNA A-37 threonylcarbamoyl transferase component Bud32
VGFWSKLIGKRDDRAAHPSGDDAQDDEKPEAPAQPLGGERLQKEEHSPTEVERLAQCGLPEGPTIEDALATFRGLRSTQDEGAALEAIAHAAIDHGVPEPLLLAAASALVDRGEGSRAHDLLQTATSPSALLLLSDLEAERGDVPRALSLVERVLLQEIDHPGALERHRRHRAALGLVSPPRREAALTTVVAAEPDSPYQLLREVARGGAGAVYEAEDRELGRRLALKVYHEPTRDRDQLLHEVRLAVALSGPGVVRVFDVDPDHGWIALEWAPLGALRERIRARDTESLLPLERWLLPLARGLARVHDAGLVHLDVKPANVLLVSPTLPVLADFGIARRVGQPSPPGSMGYVSPERLAKKPADHRDDIYGFGRVLEDVLEAVGSPADRERFLALAKLCTGQVEARPAHARDLVVRLQALT